MSFKKRAGIYAILNIINRKIYIGYSERIGKRWAKHRNRLRANKHDNIHLQSSWNKYGESKFTFFVIEELPLELSKQEYEKYETKWVLHYNSSKKEFGYNKCLPGSIPIKDNKDIIHNPRMEVRCVCINTTSGKICEKQGYKQVCKDLDIPISTLYRVISYWKGGKGGKKSYKGWIFIRKEDYISNLELKEKYPF